MQKIRILIVKVNKNFAYGKILEIIENSNIRVDNDCDTYNQCGGCNLRHMNYESTLELKKYNVANCMKKALKKEMKVNDVISANSNMYYRNKLIYPIGVNKDGKPVMGVYANRSHNIVGVKDCLIQDKTCQDIANFVFEKLVENKVKVYNEANNKGNVRHIIIRIGIKTNQVMVILVCNEKKENYIDNQLIKDLTKEFPNIKSIVKNFNSENTNVIMGKNNIDLYGNGYIEDILGDSTFRISAHSFYQVNPLQTEKLYNYGIESAGLKGRETVLDLYCGIGTISLFLAKKAKKVIGIEIVEQAIVDAKENAKVNNIENVEFYAGDVEKVLPEILANENEKIDVISVDPPRKGLDNNTINVIKSVKPNKIVYISCNPATLARDVQLLEDEYDIKDIQPVDMFCFSNHIETVCVLERK